jgi:hypothetical protein
LEFLIFIFCLTTCWFVVFKTKSIQNTSLQKKELVVLFAIKILAGFAVGIITTYLYANGTDYDTYNNLGKIETDNLLHNSNIFFTDIYKPYLDKYGTFFFVDAHFISDLGPNIILKILGILNLATSGNYYTNAIFFNSFAFVGSVALYNAFIHIYKSQKTTLIIGCFLLPSTLFFTSGIHKDLVIFTSLCFFVNALHFSLETGFTPKRILILACSFLFLSMIRLHVGAVLLPIALIYFICKKYTLSFTKISLTAITLFICSTLIVQKIKPALSPIGILTKKQNEFINLGIAKTDYNYTKLNNSTIKTAIATPSAIRNAFLSPLPFEFPYLPMNLFAVEVCIYAALFLLCIFYRKKQEVTSNMFTQFVMLFAFCMFMVIGYSITNAGSLVRYRSIYIPFLVIPMLCNIDWQRIKQKFNSQS